MLAISFLLPESDTVVRTYYHQAKGANMRLMLLVLTIKVTCKAEDR